MDEKNKRSILYEDGVRNFVSFAKTKLGGSACPCPCKNCRNRFRLEYDVVEDHLNLNGIDLSYRVWVLHGERRLQTSMEHPVVGNMEEINTEEEGLGIGNFVDAYMGHGIEIGDNEPPFVPEPDLGKSLGTYRERRLAITYLNRDSEPLLHRDPPIGKAPYQKGHMFSGTSTTLPQSLD
ncbi:hypothetical protein IFM89_014923 [Coptis chinensis]|uniref:Transposase-associated domain-containing protein n=1 Tax=Coptis chinensis TaxID=261450 RepID=A0A835LED5_9MAGN|nr:hypothetical protein IFM89_014923 [Coptis chinensis]